MPDPADVVYAVELSEPAERVLVDVADYLDEVSPDRTDAVLAGLTVGIEALANLPTKYKVLTISREGFAIRAITVHPYRIFYRVGHAPPLVTVVRIRHTSRKPESF